MTNGEYQQLVEYLDTRFAAVDRRFDTLEGRFDRLELRFDVLEFRLGELQQRVAALETRIDEGFCKCFGHFDAVYRRLERLEQEHQAIVEALRRLEALWGSDRAQREVIERDLAELRERVALLQARLDDLERRLGG
jgi:chromosome segregation ATPase